MLGNEETIPADTGIGAGGLLMNNTRIWDRYYMSERNTGGTQNNT